MCHCGSIENAQHYFFHCNVYLRQRTFLLNSVANYCTPVLHVLLQGDPSLSDAINESIFQHVHDFIINLHKIKMQDTFSLTITFQ